MIVFNFKFLIVLVLAVINIAKAEELKAMVDRAVLECKGELGANQEEIDNFINHIPQTTRTGKCFTACIQQKFKVLDKNGKVDPVGSREAVQLLKFVGEEVFKNLNHIAEICLEQVHEGEDKCEVGVSLDNCLIKESKIAGYPPYLANL